MGVPKFFRYMSERYPCLGELVKEYQIPEFDNLYLDMNGIIHICSHPNDFDPHFRISEEKIFKDIFHYIEILFRMIQPQKLFFMAVDGVAPRAKMNQQRGRRFRSAKEAEILEAKAKEKGEVLPKEARFDSNCITPGTVFMARLNEQLKYFVTYKITTDKLWQKCKVILSGHETPGEGEHKIMDYIRYMKAQPGYDSNTRHCLYGLDADLIMLGLCTHEPHFSLLREEVKFGKNQKRISTPEETTFFLLHLSLMREYIEHEFSPVKEQLPFGFDVEKIIDDWVLMGFLVGNDFIPHLPNLHITNGALPILYLAYMEVLPTLDGYINEAGTLRLDRFEKFMERLSRLDKEQFTEQYADLKFFESKTGRRPNEMERTSYKMSECTPDASPKKSANRDLEALIKSTDAMLVGHSDDEKPLDIDEDSEDDVYNMEFAQHKRDYYMNKLEYENVDADVMCSQAEGYVRAIQWNLHYYYNGCCSWSWYYPHHYAPYISDIKDFKDLKLEFDMGVPFLPFQQLLAVLPAASRNLLPEPFQALMTGLASDIIDYYPVDFKTDLNGKRQEWEAVVLIPFIDDKRLLDAMEPCYAMLTPDEIKRNSHGPMCDYTYTEENLGVYEAPEYFPQISENHAKLTLVDREDILIPEEKLIKGACPGVKLDVYYPGFPTMKHIKHSSSLQKAKVKVFEQPSRGENMIVEILPQDTPSLDDLANEILGKSIFVSWPHLVEAHVIAVSNRKYKINIASPSNSGTESFNKEEVKGALAAQWNIQKKSIAENYKSRMGVEVGETNILVHARPISGRRYVFGPQGKCVLEKQWCEVPLAYALQATVRDLTVHDPHFILYKTISEIFTTKSICFMLGHPHYGAMGEVVEAGANLKSGRVKVAMWIMQEPNLERIKQAQAEFRTCFMHGSIAAQRLGITSHLLSRITGTIYVAQGPREQLENPKHNVGLNLKFNKRNEEVPGYTRKDNGQWQYSDKAVDLIRAYMQQCPRLFEQLAKNMSNDIFHEEDLFPEGSEEVNKILAWLKEQPFYSIERRACGAEALEAELVQEIEKELDEFLQKQSNSQTGKTVMMQVKPHLLYKPSLNSGNLPPDANAQHRIYDRVVNVKESFTVPLGYKGTIVGIQKAENLLDYMYDIVFDKPFAGGLTLNICSTNRGFRLSAMGFINLSHGMRAENVKAGKPGMDASHTESWRSPANSQNQSPHPNTSAFASFNNQGGFAPAFFKSNQSAAPQQMKIMKKNNEQQSQNHRTMKQNVDVQKKVQQSMPVHASKSVTNPNVVLSARPSSQGNVQKQSEQTSEFQALWNELHNLQKSSGASQKPPSMQNIERKQSTSISTDSPQDPSAFLKAMLKISDEKSQNTPPNKPPAFPQLSKTTDAPVLVQQLFDHARQTESKKEDVSYCATLLTYSQLKGMGMPRYTYLTNKETNLVCAEIILPDMRKFAGDYCSNSEAAAESAAKKVYTKLNLDKAPKPAINVLPTPPRQWYNTPQNAIRPQNVRPMMNGPPQGPPHMPMNTPNPFMRAFNGSPKMHQQPNVPHSMPNFGQNRSQQRHFLAAQNTSKNWRTDNKSDLRRSAPFVPLQAQKQTRNSNNRHSTGSTNTGSNEAPQQKLQPEKSREATSKDKNEDKAANKEQEQSQSRSSQNHPKPQRSAKERKSRIAANFGSAPMTNGGEPQS